MKNKLYAVRDGYARPISVFRTPLYFILILAGVLLFSRQGFSQTTQLSFTTIPYSDPDLLSPARGVELWNNAVWNDQNAVRVPAGNSTSVDEYYRLAWFDIETTQQGVYNWSVFDREINGAIDAGRKFNFGVMNLFMNFGNSVGGATLSYPNYLHTQMQSEAVKDWNYQGSWVPNWNSEYFLTSWENLLKAIASHIATTTYKGVAYKNVVNYIDVRGYGDFGEWHTYPWTNTEPTGTKATSATLKRLIDSHIIAFPNYQLVIVANAYDPGNSSRIPADVAYYALTASNAYGRIGWRRDNWGDPGTDVMLSNNSATYNGTAIKDLIMETWKYAPVVGEPLNTQSTVSASCGCMHCDLERQVRFYHAASFGNGNYPSVSQQCMRDNIIAASKACGYRLLVESGNMSTAITTGTPFSITLQWKNVGIAPVYEQWNVMYELRNSSNATVWSGKSSFNPKLFLPQAAGTPFTDNFTVPASVPAGTYTLNLVVRDPNGYRKPMPLAITGKNTDGSYTLRSVTVGTGTGPANQPPVARAGNDQTASLPLALVTLDGSASSDPDGTITSQRWRQVSGPTSLLGIVGNLITTVTGILLPGEYVYELTVTDNASATATDQVKVVVNGLLPNTPPTANAGSNQTITLPTNSATLNGSASRDADGSITGYQWQQVNGPTSSTLSSTSAASITVSGLVAGVYTYQLTVTDNSNANASATVTVTVNPAANIPPIADAGTNQSILLPTNSATLNGSGSRDPDGTITQYRWAQVTGPNTATFSSTTAAIVTVSGQAAGTYTYRLTVTDNNNATNASTVTVTVNVPGNIAPVANAGANQTITLPASSAVMNGSASADADGTITGYQWAQVNGPATAAWSSGTTASPTVSGLTVAGVYTFRLTVTDNNSATNAATMTVTVNPGANIPPVANAGSSQTITLPASSAVMNGSASADADGTITGYQWAQINGPATAAWSSGTTVSPTVSGLTVAGVYTFRLTVTDNNSATNAATMTVTVNPAANVPPVSSPGNNQVITLPVSTVTMNGGGSRDSDGSITGYQWAQVSGPATATWSSSTTANPTVSGLTVAGVYAFRLTVTDNNNATHSATMSVTVNPAANVPPVANPGNNQTITLPQNSTSLNGSGSRDSDGTITAYRWQQVSGPANSTWSSTTSSTCTVSGLIAGVYTYSLTVTDNNNATHTATMRVTVNGAANNSPVANAGNNQSITLPANSVSLNGTASYDPDGSIIAYLWQQVSGPGTATFSGTTVATVGVTNLVAGTYVFRLTVTDNSNATGAATVTVLVNPAANVVPIANAGTNQTITLPVNTAALNGTGSRDPDGSITSYLWQQVSGPAASTFSATNTATINVSNLVVGIYTYRLTVRDNSNASSSATVSVTVLAASAPPVVNKLPVADADADQTITMPTSVAVLNGAKSYDPDGVITQYTWQQISGPTASTLSATTGASITVSGLASGVYSYRLTVRDNSNTTDADTINVSVMDNFRSANGAMVIYPNPSWGNLNLVFRNYVSGKIRITVYDMNRRQVMQPFDIVKPVGYFVYPMNVDRLNPGSYIVEARMSRYSTWSSKLIVQ